MSTRLISLHSGIRIPTELAVEFTEGGDSISGYNVLCGNGNVRFGRYVLPLVSGYFRRRIEMVPLTTVVNIECKDYPKETVKVTQI